MGVGLDREKYEIKSEKFGTNCYMQDRKQGIIAHPKGNCNGIRAAVANSGQTEASFSVRGALGALPGSGIGNLQSGSLTLKATNCGKTHATSQLCTDIDLAAMLNKITDRSLRSIRAQL
jgi:hypothetical protein